VQLSPPLIAGPKEFDEIAGILGDVLSEAWAEYTNGRPRATAAATSEPEAPVA
jgi:hypothetical protein